MTPDDHMDYQHRLSRARRDALWLQIDRHNRRPGCIHPIHRDAPPPTLELERGWRPPTPRDPWQARLADTGGVALVCLLLGLLALVAMAICNR